MFYGLVSSQYFVIKMGKHGFHAVFSECIQVGFEGFGFLLVFWLAWWRSRERKRRLRAPMAKGRPAVHGRTSCMDRRGHRYGLLTNYRRRRWRGCSLASPRFISCRSRSLTKQGGSGRASQSPSVVWVTGYNLSGWRRRSGRSCRWTWIPRFFRWERTTSWFGCL